MKHHILYHLRLLSIFFLTSCATIFHGSKQQISISSNPTAANVVIDGKGVGKTPMLAKLTRKHNHTIEITANGYLPYKDTLHRKLYTVGLVADIYAGLIGVGVDALTGAIHQLVGGDSTAYFASSPQNTGSENGTAMQPLLGRIITDKNDTFPKLIPDKSGRYFIVSSGFAKTFSNKITGTLTESFPYTFKDLSTNNITSHTFNGSTTGTFSSNNFIDVLNVEMVNKKQSINGGIGINSSASDEYSVYLKAGYGLALPINFLKWQAKPFLLFKPSINVLFAAGYSKSLGTIDNKDKEINLFGYTAGSQFTVDNSTDDAPSQPETYDADVLDISFTNSRTLFVPKISITNRPTGRIYWGVDAWWQLPLSQSSKIFFTQKANDKNDDKSTLGHVNFNANGSTTTFNNSIITKSPSVSALYVGVNVGIYLWPLKRK